MADASYVRYSFLGGEFSQLVQGRMERPEYVTGLNVCLNGFPIETGAWVRRPGFGFACTTRSGAAAKVIKFDFDNALPYVMEFTDLHLRFLSGRTLVTSNDSVVVSSISIADPAVVTVASAVTWATGDQVYFTLLDTSCPLLQNRVFKITKLTATTLSLIDALTDETIDGSILGVGSLDAAATINRVLDLTTVYNSGSWSAVRSIQTEATSFLLHGMFQPYAVIVTARPTSVSYATFSIEPAIFNDGPYLDPFTNGVRASPSAKTGIISITLSFPDYSATTAYAKETFVTSAGINYRSLQSQNVNHVPAASPTFWEAVNAGEAISPNGFQGGDVGRLVRLFSEPDLWAVATAYAIGDVVSYNPSGLPGQTTYWSALTANTGKIPGADLVNWRVVPQGSTNSPAIWSWGRITALSGGISGTLPGSANIGDMTDGGGLAAAFNGTLTQVASASAEKTNSSGSAVGPGTYSFTSYIGKDYSGASDQAIASATVYPSSDKGLAFGEYFIFTAFIPFTPTVTLNLRGKATLPASASDGTLLGTTTTSNTTSAVNITSTDQTTAWKYVWVEAITTYVIQNAPFGAGSFFITCIVGELVLFNPAGSATSAGVDIELLGPALLYTTPIREWRLGVYSNTTNWPSCGTYHEGRLWLSGVVANRIDASTSNGIHGGTVDFAPTDQYGNVLASSGLSYVFNAPDTNPIFWMVPDQQGVICGTKAGEWLVQSPTAGGITPFNIAARRVTTIGSANIEPRRTEHTTVFVQKFQRKIMEYFADVFSGKFSSPHITFTWKHLTDGGIDEIAYQQELNPTVWARVAGALVGCTYKRDNLSSSQGPTAAGGHRHTLGSGRTVESMTVGPSVGGNLDALTIVTNDGDPGVRHVEVLTDIIGEGATLEEASYLDDAVTPSSTTSSNTVPSPYGGLTLNGLWHLNDQTVTAWLGGLDCGDYEVSDGSITVPYGDGISGGTATGLFTAAFVDSFDGEMPMVVGFSYTSDGQLVRPATGAESGARSGPAFGKKRRSHYVIAQLEGTQGVSFGTTFAKLDVARFRSDSDVLYPVTQQFSGIWRMTLTDDYSFNGMICWRVTRPYICNIAAIGAAIQTQDI